MAVLLAIDSEHFALRVDKILSLRPPKEKKKKGFQLCVQDAGVQALVTKARLPPKGLAAPGCVLRINHSCL
jgi:hypothetical protein